MKLLAPPGARIDLAGPGYNQRGPEQLTRPQDVERTTFFIGGGKRHDSTPSGPTERQ
jgi:hypothetical protein